MWHQRFRALDLSWRSDRSGVSQVSFESYDSVLHGTTRVPSDWASDGSVDFGEYDYDEFEGVVPVSAASGLYLEYDGGASADISCSTSTPLPALDALIGDGGILYRDYPPTVLCWSLEKGGGFLEMLARIFDKVWHILHGNGSARFGVPERLVPFGVCRRCGSVANHDSIFCFA